MHFQLAPREPRSLHRLSNVLSLFLRSTVHEDIIRVSLEGHVGQGLLHPRVEREMEENVREQRAHHAPLGGSCVPCRPCPILVLHGSRAPALHVEENPPTARVPPHRPHDEVMIEGVEGRHDTLPITTSMGIRNA